MIRTTNLIQVITCKNDTTTTVYSKKKEVTVNHLYIKIISDFSKKDSLGDVNFYNLFFTASFDNRPSFLLSLFALFSIWLFGDKDFRILLINHMQLVNARYVLYVHTGSACAVLAPVRIVGKMLYFIKQVSIIRISMNYSLHNNGIFHVKMQNFIKYVLIIRIISGIIPNPLYLAFYFPPVPVLMFVV